MPFDTRLIAMQWYGGKYSVEAQTQAVVDQTALEKAGILHSVPISLPAYRDLMAICGKDEIKSLISHDRSALAWLSQLSDQVRFFIVHFAEWESGLPDD